VYVNRSIYVISSETSAYSALSVCIGNANRTASVRYLHQCYFFRFPYSLLRLFPVLGFQPAPIKLTPPAYWSRSAGETDRRITDCWSAAAIGNARSYFWPVWQYNIEAALAARRKRVFFCLFLAIYCSRPRIALAIAEDCYTYFTRVISRRMVMRRVYRLLCVCVCVCVCVCICVCHAVNEIDELWQQISRRRVVRRRQNSAA